MSTVGLIGGGCAIVGMVILIVIEVTARSTMRCAVPYTIEVASYLLPVVALWGAAYALGQKAHVGADLAVSHLPERGREWLSLFGYILGLVYLIVLDIQVINLTSTSIQTHITAMYPTRTPIGFAQLVMPIGVSLFALLVAVEILKKARQLLFH